MLLRKRRRETVWISQSFLQRQHSGVVGRHLGRQQFFDQLAGSFDVPPGRQFLGVQATCHHITVPCRKAVLLSQGNVRQRLIGGGKHRQRLRCFAFIDQLIATLNLVGGLVHLDGTTAGLSLRHGRHG
ncbi:MAG TPA: hypothetical protein PLB55_16250 [Prosthecobacter sp.]|nr:hypothetical protein [Prosthecobacter sp.]